ncbi:phage portal protein [Mycolicibacterium sphagni]|uniref:Portal protein n=1 Tax=Mycolicibacterium sphagni TaxID=1786 RepID=A0A255DM08_9MYCO|nr:phage portal protein [Mycolicibacterium sphagni]OYN80428.1 hypothetical protein CG716_09890 [Mycolicibacterium sphagni]
MAKPTTPEEWLRVLTRQADLDWARIAKLRSYVDGNAPMPEMSENTREAWVKFQRKSRTNWGNLIVEAVVSRIIPNGVTVGGSIDSPLAKQAQAIWTRNRMASVFRDWLRFGCTFRESYLTVWTDDDGKALIAADSPESMRVSVDPLQPWKVRAAVRWWRDVDAERDEAIVWMEGMRQKFFRDIGENSTKEAGLPVRLSQGQWTANGEAEEVDGLPPVIVYNNPGHAGEFEIHTDVIDRVNHGILERLTTSAMQAYRQRWLKKDKGVVLPDKDSKGNVIDYAKLFEPAPGIVWDLPAGIDLGESSVTEITGMLNASKDDIRHLGSATRTPLSWLLPDGANQTAEGANEARDGHVFKCSERLDEAEPGIEAALALALKTEGADLTDDVVVDVRFKPVDRVTLSEMYAAAAQASQAGESWQSIARNILGYSPEQIAQDNLDRAQERLTAMSFAPTPTEQPPTSEQPSGNGQAGPPRTQPAPVNA